MSKIPDEDPINGKDIWLRASELSNDISDAFETMSSITPVHGETLPISSYTTGNETLLVEESLAEPILGMLPSNPVKQFSPTVPGENRSGKAASFNFIKYGSEVNEISKMIPSTNRIVSIEKLALEYKNRSQIEPEIESLYHELEPTASVAPGVAELLRARGKVVPKDVRVSDKNRNNPIVNNTVVVQETLNPIYVSNPLNKIATDSISPENVTNDVDDARTGVLDTKKKMN